MANKRILLLIFGLLVFTSCSSAQDPIVNSPSNSKPAVPKPLELIDLSKMPPLDSKRMQTSMEDALGNKNEILDDLIANGTSSIPFLINHLDDETKIENRVIPFWYEQSVGDVALATLFDLFYDDRAMRSTVPGFGYDHFLERGSDKSITGEEVLRRYIRNHGRQDIKSRWQKMWESNKQKIYWDDDCRCFRI